MELWEHPAERYIALGSLVVIAVSLAILAGKRLTEPAALILETPQQKPATSRPTLKVHVKGAVQRPSVYTLPFGSRIIDAVQKAQPRPDADLNALNLAVFFRGWAGSHRSKQKPFGKYFHFGSSLTHNFFAAFAKQTKC